MKKMTPEQEARWNLMEKRIANVFWTLVAAALIIGGASYGSFIN